MGGTLGIAVEKSKSITGKLHQPSPVLLGLCKGSRWHGIEQHPQYMSHCDPHILPPWLAPDLYVQLIINTLLHCWIGL